MQVVFRKAFFIVIDFILINISIISALLIRFEGQIPDRYVYIFLHTFIAISLIKIIIFYIFGLYTSLWKYASIDELMQIFFATIAASIASILFATLFNVLFPKSVYMISWLLTFLLVGSSRISYRVIRRIKQRTLTRTVSGMNVMVIGAGVAGSMVIKELLTRRNSAAVPVVVVDDDKLKHRSTIHGIPVRGDRTKIKELVEEYEVEEIILAIPSSKSKDITDILNICKTTKCKLKRLPDIYELINGKFDIRSIREVSIEDLLGRDEIKLHINEISGYLEGETVLVTGAGGSIGSELCRQIGKFNPKQLLMLDIYENGVYDLYNELCFKYKGKLDMKVIIASVRDKERLRQIFDTYMPGVVFHAAAHKHVPLMEDNACEAIKNNVMGTLNLAQCADEYKAKRFVLISTDKAVNPTNIMGATKRIAEMIIQSLDKQSDTEFVAVRFGNVLGSNGSVIPLFKRQIERGGPVTVTHPEVTRFFMTIPEAAQLVIQAGAMAEGGEIFILDMGESVKIIDLAKDLIRLSGLEPDLDIKIEYTGLRPGEKLYEELLLSEEGIHSTKHEKIYVAKPLEISYKEMLIKIKALDNCLDNGGELKQCIAKVVDTYRCPDHDEVAVAN